MFYEEMQAGIKEVEKKSKKEIEESLQRGLKKGEALGEEKGMRNREKEIARQMLSKGLDIKLICDMTGLSEEKIKKLKEWNSIDLAIKDFKTRHAYSSKIYWYEGFIRHPGQYYPVISPAFLKYFQ